MASASRRPGTSARSRRLMPSIAKRLTQIVVPFVLQGAHEQQGTLQIEHGIVERHILGQHGARVFRGQAGFGCGDHETQTDLATATNGRSRDRLRTGS